MTTWQSSTPPSPTGRGKLPLVSEFVITDGDWHRVIVVWNGSHRSLYADGVEVAKDPTAQTELMNATGGLYFGATNNLASTTFFDGLIDDICIYNRALASEEAAAVEEKPRITEPVNVKNVLDWFAQIWPDAENWLKLYQLPEE